MPLRNGYPVQFLKVSMQTHANTNRQVLTSVGRSWKWPAKLFRFAVIQITVTKSVSARRRVLLRSTTGDVTAVFEDSVMTFEVLLCVVKFTVNL